MTLSLFARWRILCMIATIPLLFQCGLDQGLNLIDSEEVVKRGIRGEIVFNGAWPSNIAETRLVAAASLDTDGADLTESFVFSDPIQVGVQKVQYELALSGPSYEIIAVIFREVATSWELSNILGVYKPQAPCSILPDFDTPLTIATENTVIDSVNLSVDLTKGSINGTVNFGGVWPDSISVAVVLAFESPITSLIPCGLSILPVGGATANYKVLVPANAYSVSVFAGTGLSLDQLTFLGSYKEPGTNTSGTVDVGQNQKIDNINVSADLSNLAQ